MKMKLAIVATLCVVSFGFAQEIFTANEPGETRNRSYHVLHYKIEVTLHNATKSLDGTVTTTFVPLLPGLRTVVFDAGAMTIKRVTDSKGKELRFTSNPSRLSIDLGRPYSYDDKITVAVEYSCTPTDGLTFNNTDFKIPGKRPQIWSQGEDTTNHYWFPCYDYPNDKATCEVIGTVDSKFSLLSNGKLVSVTENPKNKTKTFHWKQDKPISSYLVMIAAGEYTILHDHVGKLPLDFYAYPDDTTDARASFKETADMIRFFDQEIGVEYPWDKYDQIILQDHFGGMENVSATTLSDVWAVPDSRGRIDNPSTSLIAHELAHQWFGDLVTCRNFRDMWLNESFASYYDPLFQRFQQGQEEFDYTIFQNQAAGIRLDTTRGRKPVVSVNSYGDNIYPRGSAILNMLRFVLGDDLYHRAIKYYLLKHEFQPVETNDLKMAIEEETGQNLQWFFDEWLYKAGHPVFDVSYTWNEQDREILLRVKQTQKQDSLTGVFKMPVDVEVTNPAESTTYRIAILSQDSTYALPSREKPLLVIFDKGNKLIKELHFDKSFDEWKYQALHAADLVDRILALRALAGMEKEGDVASILDDRMGHDSFWAVRREAVTQAASLAANSDSLKPLFKTAFITASNDVRSQVRAAAIRALDIYKGDGDVIAVLKHGLEDSSYDVMGNALLSLVQTDSANAGPVVKKYLKYPSQRDRVEATALSALSSLDSTEAVTVALTDLGPARQSGIRFSALNVIRRYGLGRADAIAAVKGIVESQSGYMQNFAVQVLGDIGDDSVIPALQALTKTGDGMYYSVSRSAKASIAKIKKRMGENKH